MWRGVKDDVFYCVAGGIQMICFVFERFVNAG